MRWYVALLSVVLLASCASEVQIGGPLPARPGTDPVDLDDDGFTVGQGDCDDLDPAVGPASGFVEVCDGLDNDCADGVDDGNVCASHAEFVQTMRLDALFVIDNSGPMYDHIDRAAEGLGTFLAPVILADNDVHVGVTSMDAVSAGSGEGGRLVEVSGRKWIDSHSYDAEEALAWLQSAFDSTISGSSLVVETEARKVTQWVFDKHSDGHNAGFARESAHLVLVYMTNREDATVDPSVDDLLDFLATERGSLKQVTAHVVVQLDDEDCHGVPSPGTEGVSYSQLREATLGTEWSICASDYEGFLSAAGQQSATEALEDRFSLPMPAKPGSVRVEIETPEGLSFLLDQADYDLVEGGNTLLLYAPPVAGSLIIVDYDQAP